MFLKFAKMNPSGNVTILVLDPVPRKEQAGVAAFLMGPESVHGEQVGFLEPAALPGARARLQMMGGEFCGNASMSAAAHFFLQDRAQGAARGDYILEVSGADGPVHCSVEMQPGCGMELSGEVCMPLPLAARETELPGGIRCPVVYFPGIAHAILPADALDPAAAQACIARWCRACGTDAFGILLTGGEADCPDMRPLVYVAATQSSVWEQSCGSGTAAVGVWTCLQRGQDAAVPVRQPGGRCITAVAGCAGDRVNALRIRGSVTPVATGSAWVPFEF